MIDDSAFRKNGKFIKGHPGYKPAPPNTDEPPTDFDAAILAAANAYGTTKKPKTGLAGYCASLRDSRPVEYAALLTKALARKQVATAMPSGITSVEFITVPSGQFLPYEAARADWAARTNFKLTPDTPQLVVDNHDTDDTDFDTPDDDDTDTL